MNYNKLKQQARQGGVPRGVPRINLAEATSATNANQTTPRDNGTVQANAIINEQVQQLAQQLANQIIAEQQQTQILARNGENIYKI